MLDEKHEDIFQFAIFVQSSVRNYELLEINVFCQKREENNNLEKNAYRLTWRWPVLLKSYNWCKSPRATVLLQIGVKTLYPTVVFLEIGVVC